MSVIAVLGTLRQEDTKFQAEKKISKEKLNKIYLTIINSLHEILSKSLWSHPPLNSLFPNPGATPVGGAG